MTSSRLSLIAALCALTLVGACHRQTREERLATVTGRANQVEIQHMLNDEFLIAIPEVKAKSDYFLHQARSGVLTREQAAKSLRLWLDAYVAAHPADVQKVQAHYGYKNTSGTH